MSKIIIFGTGDIAQIANYYFYLIGCNQLTKLKKY